MRNMESEIALSGMPNLQVLRRPVLVGLGLGGLVISWIWIAVTGILAREMNLLKALAAPCLLMIASFSCLGLRFMPLSWRSALWLASMVISLYLGYLYAPSLVWTYYFSLIVTITGLLTGPRNALLVAAILTVLVAIMARYPHLNTVTSSKELLPPLGLLWATAVATWISSRNLYETLAWALDSQERAWQTAEEVRQRRAQLRRTLDSLHLTYELLERTTHELDAARREAEEARLVKSRFVANISHELRTPLNVIVGFAEMLCFSPQTYGDFPWPAALREDLFTIWRNAEHLLKMVDDVLDLAQIEAARLPIVPEQTDLLQLIRDTLVTASALLRNSGLELRVVLPDALPPLELDATRIRQVLLNLINNALRFTQKGFIEVGAKLKEEEVLIYVKDTGMGIPADRLESIFEEFEQADTSIRRPHQGAGLGLTISRHFVRLHGGRIWAESTLGQGSTFYIALPLRKASPIPLRTTRKAESKPQPQETPSVVVFCRDPLAVRILERYAEGIHILPTTSREEIPSLVQQHHPAAMILAEDALENLARMTEQAYALLDTLKAIEIPVILCSIPTERRAGAALGVAEFLIKPVTRAELLAAIERVQANPRRILVVDDEADMRHLLVRSLKSRWAQVEVMAASSGIEALTLAQRRPDLILLDLLMPGMSGVETLHALRAEPTARKIPVIVLTARGPAESVVTTRGEVRILKNGGYAAGELVRLVTSLVRILPARYTKPEVTVANTPTTGPA